MGHSSRRRDASGPGREGRDLALLMLLWQGTTLAHAESKCYITATCR
jgi:hypothetical protein